MRFTYLAILANCVLQTASAHAQEFSVTDLGTLGSYSSTAASVNNLGQVAGYSGVEKINAENMDDREFPFLYSTGSMKLLDVTNAFFDSPYSYVTALNDDGVVVGWGMNESGLVNAASWNGPSLDLGPGNGSYAVALNAGGEAVGVDGYVQGTPENINGILVGGVPIGVVFKNGNVLNIPKGLYLAVNPSGINNSGEISAACITSNLDYRGCVVEGLTQQVLPPVPAYANTEANAINSSGYTCGFSYKGPHSAPQATVATYWKGTAATNLGAPANTSNSVCLAMDNFGQGVGAATSASKAEIGVFFDPLNGARDLNKLIPQMHIKGQGFTIENAVSLSDTGYIAANCAYQDGTVRACLLKANPVLILKNNIVKLASTDLGCVPCEGQLAPAARELPEALTDLNVDQRDALIDRVGKIAEEVEGLEREKTISQPIASLLIHNAQSVLDALQTARR